LETRPKRNVGRETVVARGKEAKKLNKTVIKFPSSLAGTRTGVDPIALIKRRTGTKEGGGKGASGCCDMEFMIKVRFCET